MDRAVVLWADRDSLGPPIGFEGADPVPCLLLSLCISAWALGLLCGCICRRAGTQGGASAPAPSLPSPVDRWERISRRAVNFVRSRRRLSLAFAHLGTYSLRNAPESRPNLRRRAARRAATPGPVLHEGPAVTDGPLPTRSSRRSRTCRESSPGPGSRERSLRTALGDPARVRELALVPRPAWDAMAQALKVPGPNDADGNPGPPRDLTLVEKARVESARRVALLRMGVAPDSPGGTGPPAPSPAPGPGPSTGDSPPGARKLKLSSVLDPTLDAEVTPLGQAEVQQLYQDYKTKFGDYPSPEADPSADQLASLRQVVSAGSAPYADFSLFGPHGLRLLRKQTFTSYTLNVATGEWSKKEQPGPASYHAWVEAWKVLRTALLLLEVADAERLDAYAEHVRSFVTQFGDTAWCGWCTGRKTGSGANTWKESGGCFTTDRTTATPQHARGTQPSPRLLKMGTSGPGSSSPQPLFGCPRGNPARGAEAAPAQTLTVGPRGREMAAEATTSRPRRRPGQARRSTMERTCPRRRAASS